MLTSCCGLDPVVAAVPSPSAPCGRLLQIHMQKRIRSPQPPEIGRPPLRRDLDTLGVAIEVVAELGRKQEMQRRRRGTGNGSVLSTKGAPDDILAEQIVVVIEESRNVDVEGSCRSAAGSRVS